MNWKSFLLHMITWFFFLLTVHDHFPLSKYYSSFPRIFPLYRNEASYSYSLRKKTLGLFVLFPSSGMFFSIFQICLWFSLLLGSSGSNPLCPLVRASLQLQHSLWSSLERILQGDMLCGSTGGCFYFWAKPKAFVPLETAHMPTCSSLTTFPRPSGYPNLQNYGGDKLESLF